jgi:hypothetical protein
MGQESYGNRGCLYYHQSCVSFRENTEHTVFTKVPANKQVLDIKLHNEQGHAVTQWLRHCATNRKVAESIPDGAIGIFH